MIPPLFEKRLKKLGSKGVTKNIPLRFTLGPGHMLFWMDKGWYLQNRFKQLTEEMVKRNFRPNPDLRFNLSAEFQSVSVQAWAPEELDLDLIVQRICEKISLKPAWYKFYGKPLGEDFIEKFKVDVKQKTL